MFSFTRGQPTVKGMAVWAGIRHWKLDDPSHTKTDTRGVDGKGPFPVHDPQGYYRKGAFGNAYQQKHQDARPGKDRSARIQSHRHGKFLVFRTGSKSRT